MREVVMSREEWDVRETETEAEAETEIETRKTKRTKMEGDGSGSPPNVVRRWEKFLPRMVMRVLLVEADDSTRQIITALLRKCNYKVAAVSDGLKAWEVLKERPHNIDLILSEVELPSISGFALLTLIMEHEVCKNIPVIMMSSHDSVSTVYNCMLRGAADYLVKPVRINELKNLWQHVWRRQAAAGSGNGPQDESVAQQKVEATAESNATSNHSSGYMACVKRNRECFEKGSDAQSSCTKPDLEAEGAYMEHMEDLPQPKRSKSLSSDMKIQKQEECVSKLLLMHESEAGGSAAAASKNDNTITRGEDMAPDSQWECADIVSEACDNDHVLVNSSREAIDLIGAFDNYQKCIYRSSASNYGTNNVDSSPLLDLSLRRSHPSGSVNQVTDERHRLKHSDASAFSRYVNRTLQPLHSTSVSICNQQTDYETNSDEQLSNYGLNYNTDTRAPMLSAQEKIISLATDQPGQAEIQFPCPQQRVFPVPVPVRGVRFESPCPAYGSVLPPMFCTQSGLSPMQNPVSSGPLEASFKVNPFYPSNPETVNSQKLHNLMDQGANNATDQMEHRQGHKLEYLGDRGHFSSATDQSASSSFYNGALSCLNSTGSGNNGNFNLVQVVRDAAECGNGATVTHDGNSHRSTQREVALTKFRMKRKDRCYMKKVRYESRKKLAEQRPRVKGQFVRQAHAEPPPRHHSPLEPYNHCGNSSSG